MIGLSYNKNQSSRSHSVFEIRMEYKPTGESIPKKNYHSTEVNPVKINSSES